MNRKLFSFCLAAFVVAALAVVWFQPKKNRTAGPNPGASPTSAQSPIAIAEATSQRLKQPSGPAISKDDTPRVIPLRLEEFDQRILLAPKEIVTVQIAAETSNSQPLKIEAPNGGSINGHKAPVTLNPSDAAHGLQFAVGPTRGLYTLEVSRGSETRIFEFWVDRESPIGLPGPERTFVR